MARKTHDIDVRMMHTTNRIAENIDEGASPDAIALLINVPGVDGPFINTLYALRAANDRKAAYTKKQYKMMSRVTKEVLAEKKAEPADDLPPVDQDTFKVTFK
ncbi:TPA: hypothetical protein UM336_000548 [Stenotrophomonas maltophilia]|nr:hypothetical protein [Stenotrophomonas maltophilia]HEL4163144.1 hypothetical protein [Stenotrophomonas maltophilia]